MDAESLVTALVRFQLVASAAILAVLLLRPLALRWSGAGTTYWLWLVVPLAAMAVFLPAREQVVTIPTAPDIPVLQQQIEPDPIIGVTREHAATSPAVQPGVPDDRSGSGLLIALWLLGAGAFLIRSTVNTRRLASSPSTGPALVGVLRPRLVLPQDFQARFNAEERMLILAHEEMHRVSRHTMVNALVEVVRCASWFNPLVHLAAGRFRADQELACDTAVMAAHPQARRTYAEALLKAQVAGVYLPMGCVWTSGTAGRLAERIARLSEQLPGRRRRFVGAAAIVGISIGASYATWAQQPAKVITVQQPNPESAAAVPEVSRPSASQVPVPAAAAQAPQGASSKAVKREPGTPAINGEPVLYDADHLRILLASPLGAARPGGAYTTEDAILDYAVAHQELWLKDAEYRRLALTRVRPRFERDYPGLAQELVLSEKDTERLFDLLAENEITRRAEMPPIPKPILGGPTPDELMERQVWQRRSQEIAQASTRRLEQSIQELLGDRYAQWQAYQKKRAQTKRMQLLEFGEMTEERMRRNLDEYHPSVTADRAQLAALQNLREGLEQVAAQNRKMRIDLERDGLLPQPPQE
jgi:beta-lactamase regulating signal transducer with metallopeptidase domain